MRQGDEHRQSEARYPPRFQSLRAYPCEEPKHREREDTGHWYPDKWQVRYLSRSISPGAKNATIDAAVVSRMSSDCLAICEAVGGPDDEGIGKSKPSLFGCGPIHGNDSKLSGRCACGNAISLAHHASPGISSGGMGRRTIPELAVITSMERLLPGRFGYPEKKSAK